MTEKRPSNPFNHSSKPQKKKPEITRKKDNAQPRVKPPRQAKVPSRSLAPPGMSGTRPNLPKPARTPEKPAKRFGLGQPGELKKEFKPIVTKPPNRGPKI